MTRAIAFALLAALVATPAAAQTGDVKTDLAAWDRFETDHPGTFRGMYLFWCAPA